MQLPETHCARARESVSAQLDNELPESEFDHLEAHLLVCPECSTWAEQVRDLTAQLRATSPEEPAERLVLSGRGRSWGRSWRVSSAVAVASAAAIVATMFFAQGQRGSGAQGLSHVGATGQYFGISRVVRLADGTVWPVRTPQTDFRHV